ncbi:MAG: hypothetical protein HY552_05040 [Elusimicrobia bacterium]|nr:hypothetical protein [Elusimicrobiota bacterium]
MKSAALLALLLSCLAALSHATFNCRNSAEDAVWPALKDLPQASGNCSAADQNLQTLSDFFETQSAGTCAPLKGYMAHFLPTQENQAKSEIEKAQLPGQASAGGDAENLVAYRYTKVWDAPCSAAAGSPELPWAELRRKAGWCAQDARTPIIRQGKDDYDKIVCVMRELGYRHDQVKAYRLIIGNIVAAQKAAKPEQPQFYHPELLRLRLAEMRRQVEEFWNVFKTHVGTPTDSGINLLADSAARLKHLDMADRAASDNFYTITLKNWGREVNQYWNVDIPAMLPQRPRAVAEREQALLKNLKKRINSSAPVYGGTADSIGNRPTTIDK